MTQPRQEMWAAVLEAALDCIIVMDTEGRVREFNPAAVQTFGYSRDEAVGRVLGDLIVPPALRERHHAGLRRYLETGEGPVLGRRIEIQAMRSDGRELPVELAIVPFSSDGERLFAGYVRDLSDRVRAQKEIRRSAALSRLLLMVPLAAASARTAEEAAEASLEAICSFMGWPLGHAYFVQDGQLVSRRVWWSEDPGRYAAFMRDTEERTFARGEGMPGMAWAQGKPVWVADLPHHPSMPRRTAAQEAGLGAALAFPIEVEGEVRAVLEFFAASVHEPEEGLLSALTVAANEIGRVMARVQAAQELAEAHERAKEEANARQRFLSLAAHELGSPLSAVKMQLMLLRMHTKDELAAKHLTVIDRNVLRLQALQKDLSDAGRIGEGRLALNPSEGSLLALARESVSSMEPLARSKGVALSVQGDDVACQFDRERIGQVLDNLLRNAIRFTPSGGRVSVQVERSGGRPSSTWRTPGTASSPQALAACSSPSPRCTTPRPGTWGAVGWACSSAAALRAPMAATLPATAQGAGGAPPSCCGSHARGPLPARVPLYDLSG